MKKNFLTAAVPVLALLVSNTGFAQLSGNVTLSNNYLWRGLTQTINEAAVAGGLDYASESGFYVGTWVSNVSYDAQDAYSYEHDMYFGFAGELDGYRYDLGYLYYNYDENANFDFGEVYGSIGFGYLDLSAYFLTNAEPNAAPGQDFGAFDTFYLSSDLTWPLASGTEIGLHLGYHEGDFAEAFNGVTGAYVDYNVSIAKDGFGLRVSKTDLRTDDNGDGIEDYASMAARDNDEIKFVASYTVNFEL